MLQNYNTFLLSLPQLSSRTLKLSHSIPIELVIPISQFYMFKEQVMDFTVTCTHRATCVEMWTRHAKEKFHNGTPVNCVGLYCEFRHTEESQAEETSI
jgi:hypothetical protein